MGEWSEMFSGKGFITDLGKNLKTTINGEEVIIGRFAVWIPAENGTRHQVVEVGSDVDLLMEKYSVSSEDVCRAGEENLEWK